MEKRRFFGSRSQQRGELLWSDGLPQTRSNLRDSPCISKLLLPMSQIHQRGAGGYAGQEASYSRRSTHTHARTHTHTHTIERSTQNYLWKWNLCSRRLDQCLHLFPLTEIKWHLFSVATMHGKCFKTSDSGSNAMRLLPARPVCVDWWKWCKNPRVTSVSA